MLRTSVRPVVNVSESMASSAAAMAVEASGDEEWTCPRCTLSNSASNVNCTVCMTRKPGRGQISLREEQENISQMNRRFSVRLKALFSKTSHWKCPLCAVLNEDLRTQCQHCHFVRTAEKTSPGHNSSVDREQKEENRKKSTSEKSSDGTASVFNSIKAYFRRAPDRSKGGVSRKTVESDAGKSKVKEEEGEKEGGWNCRQCTLLNPNTMEKCSICELPRNLQMSPNADSTPPANSGSPHQSRENGSPVDDGTDQRVNHHGSHLERKQEQQQSETSREDAPIPLTASPWDHDSIASGQDRYSLVSSQGAPTWRCGVCGTYNVVMKNLTQCFICGIGVIPECYSTMLQVRDATSAQAVVLPTPQTSVLYSPNSRITRNRQQQYLNNSLQESSEPDYVNVFSPLAALNQDRLYQQSSSPSPHPITHVNHLHASPSLSPQHITSSNNRATPLLEPQHVNPQCSPPQHRIASNHRVIPQLEPQQVILQHSPSPSPQYKIASNHRAIPQLEPQHRVNPQQSPSPSPQHKITSNDRVIPQNELHVPQISPQRTSPSPQHNSATSNGRVLPLKEPQQPMQYSKEDSHQHSNHRVIPQREPQHSAIDSHQHSNHRVIPEAKHARPVYLGRMGHFEPNPWISSMEESTIDPYSRPRTPPDARSARLEQRALLERPSRPRGYQRQHSDEGEGSQWLETSTHFNRTKCLEETRREDALHANSVYLEIQRYCRESGEPFTDPDFPPADRSLYVDPKHPVTRWRVGKWERPMGTRDDFESDGIQWTVARNPRPEDIAQGVLGNCWVLSALGVIAEQPQLIEDILITKEYSPRVGAYQVRLCRDGKWEVVVIDDCFPCLETGELVFSKAHRKQLWVPLIEKALAKLYGSYEALNAGRVLLGLSVLTGLPCEKIHLKRPSLKGDGVDTDLVWARLLSFRERGFPMSASCGGDGEEESVYAMLGLEFNHAYSILDVRQLGSERLVRLRNPWGKYSWKGSWSDQDARWDSQPVLREELQAVGADAGVFWMGAVDFFQYFCEVDVCKYRPHWHSLRSEGKLLPYAARQIKTLAFEVHTTTEVDISIYQPSDSGGTNYHLVDMAVLVLCYSSTYDAHPSPLPISCALESGSHIQSIVTTNGILAPGRYVILPLAFNHYRNTVKSGDGHSARQDVQEKEREGVRVHQNQDPPHERQFSKQDSVPYVVAVFSAQELAYENVTTRPGFLPESLVLLAEKIGKVTQPFPNMKLYEVYLKHSCRYLVAVNLDKRLHFTVTCDGLDSVNVTSSRGALFTQDCIPPRHRQVLWVLTQLEGTARYSVLMRISTTCTQLNTQDQWGAQHAPPLNTATTELHAPRLIS